jgi:hypothetical protein
MQINPLNLTTPVLPAAAAGVQALRISAGDVSQIQTGLIVAASVLKTSGNETVLDVGGRPLSVQGPLNLSAGDVLNVRLNGGTNPTLELIGQPSRPPARSTVPPQSTADPGGRVGVIDVLSQEPNEQVRVTIDGEEAVVTSDRPLATGGRYVAQVERGPTGIAIKALPDTPQLSATVATAVLRGTPTTQLGDTIQPLIQELEAAIAKPTSTKPPSVTVGKMVAPADAAILTATTVRTAAIEVRTALNSVIPPPGEPPTVETLKALVQDGGQQFEAKLSLEVARGSAQTPTEPDIPTTEQARNSTAKPIAHDMNDHRPTVRAETDFPATIQPSHDLKGGLLNLLRTVSGLSADFPVAEAVLTGIERQQAVNVLAMQDGGPLVVQVPFPDGPHWRTVSLGIEPDRSGTADESGRPTGFRVMMHVPLSDLGETWIDAGADGSRLRAVLFLGDSQARERVRPDLPDLRQELQAAGFTDVLLDVRSAAELTDQQRRRANAIRSVAPESGGLLDVRA